MTQAMTVGWQIKVFAGSFLLLALVGCTSPADSTVSTGGNVDDIKFPGSRNRGEVADIYGNTDPESDSLEELPPTITPLPTREPTTVAPNPTRKPDQPVRVQNPSAVPTTPGTPAITPEALPEIEVFELSANSINPGGTVVAQWKTTGKSATIMMLSSDNLELLGEWTNLPPQGTLDITIPQNAKQSVNVSLVAAPEASLNTSANVVHKSVTLSCSTEWFFDNPPFDCPEPARMWRGVAQYFENGFMIWIPSQGGGLPLIKVLYYSGWLEQIGDGWQEGMPESDPSLVPPDGWYQPVRGFGRVWRDGNRRETLGWATSTEFEFGGATQKWVSDLDATATTYELTPSGVLKLDFDNLWIVWPTN